MRLPVRERSEARVADPLRVAHRRRGGLPLLLRQAGDREPAVIPTLDGVAHAIGAVWRGVGDAVAETPVRRRSVVVREDGCGQGRHRGLELRHVDQLSLAGPALVA